MVGVSTCYGRVQDKCLWVYILHLCAEGFTGQRYGDAYFLTCSGWRGTLDTDNLV